MSTFAHTYKALLERIRTEIPGVVRVDVGRFQRGAAAVIVEDCGTFEGEHEYEVVRLRRDRDTGVWERTPGGIYDNAGATFETVEEWLT